METLINVEDSTEYMPNPRYLDRNLRPTAELLEKIRLARLVYMGNLQPFVEKWGMDRKGLANVEKVYLIGSHATPNDWKNETSDIDFKLVVPDHDAEMARRYKTDVLRPLLCQGFEKQYWIDIYLVHEDYQVTDPRFDVTNAWNGVPLEDIIGK